MWRGPLTIRLIKYPNLCLYDPEFPQRPLHWVHVNRVKRAVAPEDVTEPQIVETEAIPQRDHSAERAETTPVATEPITDRVPPYNLRPRGSTRTVDTVCFVSGDLRLQLNQKRAIVQPPASLTLVAPVPVIQTSTIPCPSPAFQPNAPNRIPKVVTNYQQVGMRSPLEPRASQCLKCTGFGHGFRACASLTPDEQDKLRRNMGDAVRLSILRGYDADPMAKELLSVKADIYARWNAANVDGVRSVPDLPPEGRGGLAARSGRGRGRRNVGGQGRRGVGGRGRRNDYDGRSPMPWSEATVGRGKRGRGFNGNRRGFNGNRRGFNGNHRGFNGKRRRYDDEKTVGGGGGARVENNTKKKTQDQPEWNANVYCGFCAAQGHSQKWCQDWEEWMQAHQ